MKGIVLAALVVCQGASAQLNNYVDYRLCGDPIRDQFGVIVRSQSVLASFQRIHPCPSTGLASGPCPRWGKDHVIPLANGGCDSVTNLQWLPYEIKNAAGVFPKDRWERKVYAKPQIIVDLP